MKATGRNEKIVAPAFQDAYDTIFIDQAEEGQTIISECYATLQVRMNAGICQKKKKIGDICDDVMYIRTSIRTFSLSY